MQLVLFKKSDYIRLSSFKELLGAVIHFMKQRHCGFVVSKRTFANCLRHLCIRRMLAQFFLLFL